MDQLVQNIYTFGDFKINGPERILRDGFETVALPPKVFDTLLMLVQHPGQVLAKERHAGGDMGRKFCRRK